MFDVVAKCYAFLRNEEGLVTVEYAISGAIVAAGSITAFSSLGVAIMDRINTMCGYVRADGSACG